jgi:GT2 family glycosyltransferase
MAELTEKCLASLDKSPFKEVIVVDDCSPYSLVLSGVNHIKRDTNGGFPKCANTGFAATSGDIIILSNNDIEFTPGWLEAILAPLDQGYDISSVRMSDSDGMTTEDKITEGDRFGSLWAMKRRVYETIGGFDENFDKGTFEDLDFHKRAEAAGFRIAKNHSVVVKHVGRATMDKLYPDRRDFYEGRIHYEQKYGVVE